MRLDWSVGGLERGRMGWLEWSWRSAVSACRARLEDSGAAGSGAVAVLQTAAWLAGQQLRTCTTLQCRKCGAVVIWGNICV